MGISQNGGFNVDMEVSIMEHPMKMDDDWGVIACQEPPISASGWGCSILLPGASYSANSRDGTTHDFDLGPGGTRVPSFAGT